MESVSGGVECKIVQGAINAMNDANAMIDDANSIARQALIGLRFKGNSYWQVWRTEQTALKNLAGSASTKARAWLYNHVMFSVGRNMATRKVTISATTKRRKWLTNGSTTSQHKPTRVGTSRRRHICCLSLSRVTCKLKRQAE